VHWTHAQQACAQQAGVAGSGTATGLQQSTHHLPAYARIVLLLPLPDRCNRRARHHLAIRFCLIFIEAGRPGTAGTAPTPAFGRVVDWMIAEALAWQKAKRAAATTNFINFWKHHGDTPVARSKQLACHTKMPCISIG
jgi:hypothetical protein